MKQPPVIIIRGNSGAGKSTVAKLLQATLQPPMVLLAQDTIRRHVLAENGTDRRDYLPLAMSFVRTAHSMGYGVILEGIFPTSRAKDALISLINETEALAVYLNVTYEETVRRYHTKPEAKRTGYGPREMKRWYTEGDTLDCEGELIISEAATPEEVVAQIEAVLSQ